MKNKKIINGLALSALALSAVTVPIAVNADENDGYRLTGIYNKEAMKYVRKFNPELIHNQTDFGIGLFARVSARLLDVPLINP